jgi:hypothetical protein
MTTVAAVVDLRLGPADGGEKVDELAHGLVGHVELVGLGAGEPGCGVLAEVDEAYLVEIGSPQ